MVQWVPGWLGCVLLVFVSALLRVSGLDFACYIFFQRALVVGEVFGNFGAHEREEHFVFKGFAEVCVHAGL